VVLGRALSQRSPPVPIKKARCTGHATCKLRQPRLSERRPLRPRPAAIQWLTTSLWQVLGAAAVNISIPQACMLPTAPSNPCCCLPTARVTAAQQASEILPGRFYFTALKRADSLKASHIAATSICYSIDDELVRCELKHGGCCAARQTYLSCCKSFMCSPTPSRHL
jgi:hypothetical protein